MKNKPKTRAEFNDKFFGIPISERVKLAKSVDLRDNYKFENLGNGYGKIIAINSSKTY